MMRGRSPCRRESMGRELYGLGRMEGGKKGSLDFGRG